MSEARGPGRKVFVQGSRCWQAGQWRDLGSGRYQRAPASLKEKQHIRDVKSPSSTERSLISSLLEGELAQSSQRTFRPEKGRYWTLFPWSEEKIVIKMVFISTHSGLPPSCVSLARFLMTQQPGRSIVFPGRGSPCVHCPVFVRSCPSRRRPRAFRAAKQPVGQPRSCVSSRHWARSTPGPPGPNGPR